MIKTDIVVIGAGVAGLTCATYLKRANADFAILEKSAPGGKLLNVDSIENYPGYTKISGADLAYKIYETALHAGVDIVYDDVVSVEQSGKGFLVKTNSETYECLALIVGTGLSNIPTIKGEKRFFGKGISYCVTCDGPLYRGKKVAIYGDSERANLEALYLSNLVGELTYLFPEEELVGAPESISLLKSKDNVRLIPSAKIDEIRGDEEHLQEVEYHTPKESGVLSLDAFFPLAGEKSASAFLSSLPLTLKNGFIPVNENCESSLPGLYAIGDVVDKKLRQVVNACGEGAVASSSAMAYVRSRK